MANPRTFSNLRNILAQLYPDEASARRVIHDAGLSETRIPFSTIAINTWHTILSEAENTNRVDALLDVVLQEYGANLGLREAYDAYRNADPLKGHLQNDSEKKSLTDSGGPKTHSNLWAWRILLLLLAVVGLFYGAKSLTYIRIPSTPTQPEATPTTVQTASLAENATPTLTPTVAPTAVSIIIPVTATTTLAIPTLITSTSSVTAVQSGIPFEITGIINSSVGINARSEPTATSSLLFWLRGGIAVTVTGRSADSQWLQVRLADGTVAWVITEYVDVSGEIADLSIATSTQLNTQTPQAGATRISPKDGAIYAYIPAGEILMGASDDWRADNIEKPQHKVFVDEFWIMQTEVTNAEYKSCVDAGVCTVLDNDRWNDAVYAEHPVTDISWNQASIYAKWVGGRLPTEAEWEKACRGTTGLIYTWGNQEPSTDHLNFYESGLRDTAVVRSYAAGMYGLYDISGNVWEWTSSWGMTYPYDPTSDLATPKVPGRRVLRGGSFQDSLSKVRCTFRRLSGGDPRDSSVGFRVTIP